MDPAIGHDFCAINCIINDAKIVQHFFSVLSTFKDYIFTKHFTF